MVEICPSLSEHEEQEYREHNIRNDAGCRAQTCLGFADGEPTIKVFFINVY